jgi:Opacity protein and related surface antigens
MKKIFAAIALTLFAGSAIAADLPKRVLVPASYTVAVDPNSITGFYLGAGGGYAFNAENYVFNARGGYDFGYVRLEADYDYLGNRHRDGLNLVTGNALFEYSFNRITPYALVGTGVVFNEFGNREGVYNVGGGVRYNVTSNVEVDGRYRYVDTINQTRRDGEHVTTLGVNYKF